MQGVSQMEKQREREKHRSGREVGEGRGGRPEEGKCPRRGPEPGLHTGRTRRSWRNPWRLPRPGAVTLQQL